MLLKMEFIGHRRTNTADHHYAGITWVRVVSIGEMDKNKTIFR